MSMKHNFRSKNGCVVCGRKSSTSRFKSSEPYADFFQAAFQIEYRKGDFCNPCSLALNRFKKDPEGKRRDFSGRVNKCRRVNGQGKGFKAAEKSQRKQDLPRWREPGPLPNGPFPHLRPTKHRRKRVATPDAPWMKYTNMWRSCTVYQNGLEFAAQVNDHLQMYLINVESSKPCQVCEQLRDGEEGPAKLLLPPFPQTLPAALPLPLPPSPLSSADEDKSSASSPSTPGSFKENLAPGLEEEMEDDDLASSPSCAEDAASALMSICNATAAEMYLQHMEKDASARCLRVAPNQGCTPLSVGCMP